MARKGNADNCSNDYVSEITSFIIYNIQLHFTI